MYSFTVESKELKKRNLLFCKKKKKLRYVFIVLVILDLYFQTYGVHSQCVVSSLLYFRNLFLN